MNNFQKYVVSAATPLLGWVVAEFVKKLLDDRWPNLTAHPAFVPAVAVALVFLAVTAPVVFYLFQIKSLNTLTGEGYKSVKSLRSPSPIVAQSFLHLANYHEYFKRQKEFATAVSTLRESAGRLLIVGVSLSGKTRMATEIIKATRPDAYLLKFSGPENLTPANIGLLNIPARFIVFGKPRVVLFFDDLDRFAGKPINELLLTLENQVSELSIVATCRSGDSAATAMRDSAIRESGLLNGIVEMVALTEEEALEIYRSVWPNGAGPSVVDMARPGAIVIGLEEKLRVYTTLPEELKRVITGLGLIQACGAQSSQKSFLMRVMEQVFDLRLTDSDKAFARLEELDFIFSDKRGNLSIQHDCYRDADQTHYYQGEAVSRLKADLNKLAAILVEEKADSRLAGLGAYLWLQLRDFAGARAAFENSIILNPANADHYLNAAMLYTVMNENTLAARALEKGVALAVDADKKAALFHGVAEAYYTLGLLADAADYFHKAIAVASSVAIRQNSSMRYGDCLVRNSQYLDAAAAYRSIVKDPREDIRLTIDARLTACFAAQESWLEVRQTARNVFRDTPEVKWVDFVARSFDAGEVLLLQGDPRIVQLYNVVWEEFRDRASVKIPSTEAKPPRFDFVNRMLSVMGLEFRVRALDTTPSSNAKTLMLDFASRMLNEGFLPIAREAHYFLLAPNCKLVTKESERISLFINLGAIFRDLEDFTEARRAFSGALDASGTQSALTANTAAAIAGVADCDLLESHDLRKAQTGYQRAFDFGTRSKDLSSEFWGRVGLGDVLLEQQQYSSAEELYRNGLHYVGAGADSRLLLGLGRASLRLGKLDSADLYLTRGAAVCQRHSYSYRLKKFSETYDQFQAARELARANPLGVPLADAAVHT